MNTIDQYHAQFEGEVLKKLNEIRALIKSVAPQAQECISYNMPAFKQNKVLVYYAANKNHIGFYPTAQPIVHFSDQLQPYHTSKGAIQFPWNTALPKQLIQDIVRYRLAQVQAAK